MPGSQTDGIKMHRRLWISGWIKKAVIQWKMQRFLEQQPFCRMFFREMGKIYRYGTAVHAINYKSISPEKMAEIEKATDKLAEKIRKNYGHVKPVLKTKTYFEVMRKLVKSGWNEVDVAYWKEHGWTEKARPWR